VRFQNSAIGLDLGFYAARWVFVDEAAGHGAPLDPLVGEVGGGVAGAGGAWRLRLGPSLVAVGLVFGQDRPQVPFATDQHPVGDLGQAVSTNRSA